MFVDEKSVVKSV